MTDLGLDATLGSADRSASFVENLAKGPNANRIRSRHALTVDAVALGCAVAVAALMMGSAGLVVWLSSGYVALILLLEFSAMPAYERLRSPRPTAYMLGLGGLFLLLAMAFELLKPVEARGALLVVTLAAVARMLGLGVEAKQRRPHAVLLVGGRTGVGEFVGQWAGRSDINMLGICLAEFVDESAPEILGIPILGSLEDVSSIASDFGVDQVVVAPGPMVSPETVRRLGWSLERSSIEFLVAAEVDGAEPRRIRTMVQGRRLMLSVRPSRPSAPTRLAKSAIDRVGAALLIVAFTPVFLITMFLIRRDSAGGAVFRQQRIGVNGEPFTMLKFRTMVADAESLLDELLIDNEASGPLFKLGNDPRTTRVGRLLRRSSLDELPQLFNVLMGQMSLIGPRPSLPNESRHYDDWVARRLAIRPGMTGSWQVSGRSNLSWSDSIRLDLGYVDNVTIASDFSIAARTARALIRRDGAM